MKNQIKSRYRVSNFGEVNTSSKEINGMLNLVKSETERIDSRFLEQACGDGNFLIEVLDRKIAILLQKFKKNQYEFEKNSIILCGSIYGIELLKDNVESARARLSERFLGKYNKLFKKSQNLNFKKSILTIFKKNIIQGDAITLKNADSNKPVIFSEWSLIKNKIKRRDFAFSDLISYAPFEKNTLFSDLGEKVIIPKPIKEYDLIEFDRIFIYE